MPSSLFWIELESLIVAKKTKKLTRRKMRGIWRGMCQRCSNPEVNGYEYYGGRGILVCKSWQDSFDTFCKDMGDKPKGLSLDRIDNNGNYEPENCRWTTWEVQSNNRRHSIPRKANPKWEDLALI